MTKIVHLCLACFFPDGYSYQENLLPKFHKRLGYDVEVIASPLTFGSHGERAFTDAPASYENEYGIPVARLAYRSNNSFCRKIALFSGVYEALERSKPDILFIHGCQFLSMPAVVKYLDNNRTVRVYVDNHADYSNSARTFISKYFLHRVIWKHCARIIEPYCSVFWGVLPARVDFMIDNYNLPINKCKLLVMGGDDDEIQRVNDGNVGSIIRRRFHIANDDCLIVTGGKIDGSKREVLDLIASIKQLRSESNRKVKLLIFGPVAQEMESDFRDMLDPSCIHYIPWADRHESYDYFAAADLVVFPGRHSVYWEQVVALGKPMIVKEWQGTKHVDAGGNVVFIANPDVATLRSVICNILDGDELGRMERAAKDIAADYFLYSNIAKRSIGQGE